MENFPSKDKSPPLEFFTISPQHKNGNIATSFKKKQ